MRHTSGELLAARASRRIFTTYTHTITATHTHIHTLVYLSTWTRTPKTLSKSKKQRQSPHEHTLSRTRTHTHTHARPHPPTKHTPTSLGSRVLSGVGPAGERALTACGTLTSAPVLTDTLSPFFKDGASGIEAF